MIYYKTIDEIELIRISSLLVTETIAFIGSILKPGISTLQIDRKAEEFIRDFGGVPSFKGYKGFPGSLCISLNDHVVHGIPNHTEIKETDVVSIDCGVFKNGFHGDSAYTFLMANQLEETIRLAQITQEALINAIEVALIGNRIGDLSWTIQNHCETKNGYGIVRELVGHGIGKKLHEEPEVPNFGTKGQGPKLLEGLVIAIEPMVNLGTKQVIQEKDGWTIRTKDGKVSVHFEHTIAITKLGSEVLSSFTPIESVIKTNKNLFQIKEIVEA